MWNGLRGRARTWDIRIMVACNGWVSRLILDSIMKKKVNVDIDEIYYILRKYDIDQSILREILYKLYDNMNIENKEWDRLRVSEIEVVVLGFLPIWNPGQNNKIRRVRRLMTYGRRPCNRLLVLLIKNNCEVRVLS